MTDEQQKPDGMDVRLRFIFPPRMPSVKAHNLIIQQDETDVVLSFFETQLPMFSPREEERYKTIERLRNEGLGAECVAKVRVAKHSFPAFVNTMQETLSQIEREMEQLEEDIHANDSADNQ